MKEEMKSVYYMGNMLFESKFIINDSLQYFSFIYSTQRHVVNDNIYGDAFVFI